MTPRKYFNKYLFISQIIKYKQSISLIKLIISRRKLSIIQLINTTYRLIIPSKMMISSKRYHISKLKWTISKSIYLFILICYIKSNRYHIYLRYHYRIEYLLCLEIISP